MTSHASLQLSSFNRGTHLNFFFIVPSLQISCFRKTKARKTVRLKISVSRPDLFDSQSFTVCVIFAYIVSRWGGENNGFLAGVSLAPSHLARPKPPFLSFSNACHHRQPRLCRSSLEFEFYRECRRTNKIRSNFRHNLSVIFAVLLGFIADYCQRFYLIILVISLVQPFFFVNVVVYPGLPLLVFPL